MSTQERNDFTKLNIKDAINLIYITEY